MATIDEARATFNSFDGNGDGFITAEEFAKAMAKMGDFHAVATAPAVIAAKDENGDGLLSFDEFWAHLNQG